MHTYIERSRHLAAEPWSLIHRFMESPSDFLPEPAHPLGDDQWRVDVHAGPLHHEVVMTVGAVWTLPDVWVRPISWTPSRKRDPRLPLLPDLTGRIALRQYDTGMRLEVAGHYRPPLGRAGELLDAWQLRQVAERTLDGLADEVAVALGQEVTAG